MTKSDKIEPRWASTGRKVKHFLYYNLQFIFGFGTRRSLPDAYLPPDVLAER